MIFLRIFQRLLYERNTLKTAETFSMTWYFVRRQSTDHKCAKKLFKKNRMSIYSLFGKAVIFQLCNDKERRCYVVWQKRGIRRISRFSIGIYIILSSDTRYTLSNNACRDTRTVWDDLKIERGKFDATKEGESRWKIWPVNNSSFIYVCRRAVLVLSPFCLARLLFFRSNTSWILLYFSIFFLFSLSQTEEVCRSQYEFIGMTRLRIGCSWLVLTRSIKAKRTIRFGDYFKALQRF